mmetsp:Transcript_121078/g.270310  ORF Transcript_121078/g.270310 Transcript_121078/m.270310 type:complete len:172 (+) Transcript_121078:111-626(+)
MMLRTATALLFALMACHADAGQLRLPNDVGGGKGGNHPCVAVMREAQAACGGQAYGSADSECGFAVCYSADLNRERCADVVTDGTPTNVLFPADLDKLKAFHAIKCDDGQQGGDGRRNARFDCGNVNPDGLWSGKTGTLLLTEFAARRPASSAASGLTACLAERGLLPRHP